MVLVSVLSDPSDPTHSDVWSDAPPHAVDDRVGDHIENLHKGQGHPGKANGLSFDLIILAGLVLGLGLRAWVEGKDLEVAVRYVWDSSVKLEDVWTK